MKYFPPFLALFLLSTPAGAQSLESSDVFDITFSVSGGDNVIFEEARIIHGEPSVFPDFSTLDYSLRTVTTEGERIYETPFDVILLVNPESDSQISPVSLRLPVNYLTSRLEILRNDKIIGFTSIPVLACSQAVTDGMCHDFCDVRGLDPDCRVLSEILPPPIPQEAIETELEAENKTSTLTALASGLVIIVMILLYILLHKRKKRWRDKIKL